MNQRTTMHEPAYADDYRSRANAALSLWLRWNEVYEQVTKAMFDQRRDLAQLQQTMDLADELRRQAVAMTQELLGR